jgi:hypothetical protein
MEQVMDRQALHSYSYLSTGTRSEEALTSGLPAAWFGYYFAWFFAYFQAPFATLHAGPGPVTW